MDVMFYEAFREEEEALRRYLPLHVKASYSQDSIQASRASSPPAGLICIRTHSIIPACWEQQLSGILTRSTGFDHLIAFRKRCAKHIHCGYLPSYCAHAVAEHALLLMLSLARKLRKQARQFMAFDRNNITGVECSGRGILVVGVGHIGTELARLAAGIGMRVKGVDIVRRMDSLEYVALADGIRRADFIVCCLPLTKTTRGMLSYEVMRHAKSGAIFINIARGEIAPLRDLRRLLDEGILAGLGLDVYEDEELLAESLRHSRDIVTESARDLMALQGKDNVLCTPHNAFNTREALERKAQQSCRAIAAFLDNGTFPDAIPED